jgi:hypothetical protein
LSGGFLFLLPVNITGSPVAVLGALNPLGALVDPDPLGGAGEDLAGPAELLMLNLS